MVVKKEADFPDPQLRYEQALREVIMALETGKPLPNTRTFERRVVNIQALRDRYDLTQEHLACIVGVSPRTLRDWEEKQHIPDGRAQKLLEMLEDKPDFAADLLRSRRNFFKDGTFRSSSPGRYGVKLYESLGKRILDIFGASVLIVLLLPLFALIAVSVAADGGRPIFAHERIGRHGRRFFCYKFRTMVHDAEAMLPAILRALPRAAAEWAANGAISDDPRVTGIGRVLRGTSLDELPQLWNVLRGDMSLVGPRPVTEAEFARYGEHQGRYLSVRPGLTGLWKVSGRHAITHEDRIALDVDYMRSVSLGRDLLIMLLEAVAVTQLVGPAIRPDRAQGRRAAQEVRHSARS